MNTGVCACGCGQATKPARVTHRARGWVRGEPLRFVHGHGRRLSPERLRERFWSFVDKSAGPDACWPWTGYTRPDGYGQYITRRGMGLAHRTAWEFVHGPIPDGLNVLHSCDNPPCCNAERHHFLGTQADNVADMLAKGRHVP